MKITFIGQGLSPSDDKSAMQCLDSAIKSKTFDSLTIFVAFASKPAVQWLCDLLNSKPELKNESKIYVGIDLKGTSKEALKVLLKEEIVTYIFHTTSPFIYHPKVYLLKGKSCIQIVIGSFNLTSAGMARNVEAGVKIEFDLGDTEGEEFLDSILDNYASVIDGSDPNTHLLTEKLLGELDAVGLLATEKEIAKTYKEKRIKKNKKAQKLVNELFPTRSFKPLPKTASKKKSKKASKVETKKKLAKASKPKLKRKPIKFWLEAGSLTSASRNQLDLSMSGGHGDPGGSVNLFGIDGSNAASSKELVLWWNKTAYYSNTISFPMSLKTHKTNGTWRLYMNGTSAAGERLTEISKSKFIGKILVFSQLKEKEYSIETLESNQLQSLKDQSVFWDTNGTKRGRHYGKLT